jgi:hypothetical protein
MRGKSSRPALQRQKHAFFIPNQLRRADFMQSGAIPSDPASRAPPIETFQNPDKKMNVCLTFFVDTGDFRAYRFLTNKRGL